MGYQEMRRGFRGVYLETATFADIYRLNYGSRLASRVLFPLISFPCRNREDLYKAVMQKSWEPYFKGVETFSIDANVDHPEIRNSLFAAQVVKDAIVDQLIKKSGFRPSIDTKQPDLLLNLFLRSGKAVLSFDTSLEPLHKRGYRLEAGDAPLRETMAAALLRLSRYDRNEILIDPCAGSGTFLIEAALIASWTPPGTFRKKWGFTRLPEFKEKEWLKVKVEMDSKRVPLSKGHFFGVELNKNTHRIALGNLRAAGLHPFIEISQGDFRQYHPPKNPTFLISNPPHGRRMGEEETLIPLYRGLGDFMKQKMAKPSRGFIFTGSLLLSKEIGLAAKKKTVMDNGGVESRLLEFDLY